MAFQDITGIQIGQAAITAVYTTVATVDTAKRIYVKDIDVCNTTAAAIGVYIHLAPPATSADISNALFYNSSIAAYDNLQWTGTQLIDAGWTIQVKASAVGCTVTISGGQAV